MTNIFKQIGEKFFVKDLKDNTLGTIKIALLREVTGNLIIRSNYADETITLGINGEKDVVEIPSRKLKSKEKLLGIKICRDFNVVDNAVRYNVIKEEKQLANPNSILFGDSITESNKAIGLTSRVIYDWAYSIRDINEISSTLQHNALSEGGTMWDEDDGKLRQSLFQVQYIKPGTFFPHFLTVENVTPELLFHLLSCVIFENRYGAQSTTISSNMKNHILGFGLGNFESSINSYYISKNWNCTEPISLESVQKQITIYMQKEYGEDNYIDATEIVGKINQIWLDYNQTKVLEGNNEIAKNKLDSIYKKSKLDCESFLKKIKIWK